MEKFIPYNKLSKKAKREIDRKKRVGWNGINPTTRRAVSKKTYNRNTEKSRMAKELNSSPYGINYILFAI